LAGIVARFVDPRLIVALEFGIALGKDLGGTFAFRKLWFSRVCAPGT
jgi:hypothetical protein